MNGLLRLLVFLSYRSFVDDLSSGLSRGGFRIVTRPGTRQRVLGMGIGLVALVPLYLALSLLLNPWRFTRPEHVAVAAPVLGATALCLLFLSWVSLAFTRKIVIKMNGTIRVRVKVFPIQFELSSAAEDVTLLDIDRKSSPVELIYFSTRRYKRFPLFTLPSGAVEDSLFWKDFASFLESLPLPQGDPLLAACGRKPRRVSYRQR